MLISIIIPASNSENTIDRCVQSVINQKFQKFELLIVENNSTDLTWVKLLSLKSKYNKIRLFRNKKSGTSRARNLGILKSRGKYILFLDSDDELKKDSLIHLYKFITDKKIDFAIGSYTNKIDKKEDDINRPKLFTKNDISKYLISYCLDQNKFTAFTHVWGRLYSKRIILKNKIKFNPNFNQLEDILFNLDFLNHSKRVGYLNKIVYQQNIQNIQSRSSFKFDHKIIFLITYASKRIEKFLNHINVKKNKKEIRLIVENFVVSKILTYIIRICFNVNFIIQKKSILIKIYDIFKLKFRNYRYIPLKNQDTLIYFCLKNLSFNIFYVCCFVKNILLNISRR